MNPEKLETPDIAELRRAIETELSPERLRISRGHDGAVFIRVLSAALEGVDDPLQRLEASLHRHQLTLPSRTLTLLKAPSDLEEGEKEELFGLGERVGVFAGTPNWADALLLEPSEETGEDDRHFSAPVAAFWSVKGGVGRTTALAHVAALLGRRGKRVLALDLDLDSPGLIASLSNGDLSTSMPRFEDLVRLAAVKQPSKEQDEELKEGILRSLQRIPKGYGSVEILGPLYADGPFIQSLLGPLTPSALYRGGRRTLRRLVQQAIEATRADVVLVDSRSGYCDESAMAVLDLADHVVLFAPPNPGTFSSLAPALEAIERHFRVAGHPSQLLMVAGMLPAGEEARHRVLEGLREAVEETRVSLAAKLGVEEALPADLDLIEVSYSDRIVENSGTVLLDASDGYREISERILPTGLPATIASGLESNWVATVIKEAEIPVAQAESEDDPANLAQLFTRTQQLDAFARHDVCLVKGAKGTGKSYLHRMCLEHQDLLAKRTGIPAIRNIVFVDGLSEPRGGRGASPRLNREILVQIGESYGDRWDVAWSALALARAVARIEDGVGLDLGEILRGPTGGQIRKLSRETSPAGIVRKLKSLLSKPLELEEIWHRLDEDCGRAGRTLCLLFDWLDVALGDDPTGIKYRGDFIRGLFTRVNSSWLSRRHLCAKIFLREDVFRSLELEEEAKYSNRSVTLKWEPEDVWRLVIRAMAVGSATYKEHIESRGVAIERLEEIAEDDWRGALALIWGERFGTSESSTRSVAWAHRRLKDGQDRLFPRAAIWLLQFALEQRKRLGVSPDWPPPVLDPSSLRDAMPKVSEQRLAELKREASRDERRLIERIKGFRAYLDRSQFLEDLGKAGQKEPETGLGQLHAIGLVEYGRRRDDTPTVRIVDLYAFAPELKIERLGRR